MAGSSTSASVDQDVTKVVNRDQKQQVLKIIKGHVRIALQLTRSQQRLSRPEHNGQAGLAIRSQIILVFKPQCDTSL